MNTQTIAELEALPMREGGYFADAGWFPRLLIVPSAEVDPEHDYRHFRVIGANSDGKGLVLLSFSDNVRMPKEATGDYPNTIGERGDIGLDIYANGVVSIFGRFHALSVAAHMEDAEIIVKRRDNWLNEKGLLTFEKLEND